MSGAILTTASQVECLHGGQALLFTSNVRTMADGFPALLESDVHLVFGCPFTVGTRYSPCIRIEWVLGAPRVKVNGTPVLVQTSLGKCFNLDGAMQGLAVIASTQMEAITG
jgi:hypothetical protein